MGFPKSRVEVNQRIRPEPARYTWERYERIVRLHIDARPTRAAGRSAPQAARPEHRSRRRLVSTRTSARSRRRPPRIALIALEPGLPLRRPPRLARRQPRRQARTRRETPLDDRKPVAILEGDELARFLAHAGDHRPLFEFLAYTGLRIGEALGLTWADIDHDAGLIRVHRQLTRHREHAPLKTDAGKREVILAPALAKQLREHWLATRYKAPHRLRLLQHARPRHSTTATSANDFRARPQTPQASGASGRLSLHSLRHGFASLLIANGLNVVFVSRQLGHANPNITLEVYAHLFERADHADTARAALDASYAAINGATG